jgi:hypothetical protein
MVATLFRRQVKLSGHGLAQAVAPEAEAGSDERQEQLEMSKMWRENEILAFWRENEILAGKFESARFCWRRARPSLKCIFCLIFCFSHTSIRSDFNVTQK